MLRIILIPVGLLGLLIAAMVWSGGAAETKADFTFINRGELGTLDPNRMSWMQDIRIGYGLWEGLYTLDSKTLEATAGCADPIELNSAKTVYTFHIRPNAKWSDGTDVLAKDFVFAWRRMLEESGDYTYLLHYIEGAEDYEKAFPDAVTAQTEAHGKWEKQKDRNTPEPLIEYPKLKGIETFDSDPRLLRVTLKHPVAFFPDILRFSSLVSAQRKVDGAVSR